MSIGTNNDLTRFVLAGYWFTLAHSFDGLSIYTDIRCLVASWSCKMIVDFPSQIFSYFPGQTCINDRSIYCCESHDLSNRNLHWLPGLHPMPRQATTTKQPKRCRLDAQKSPTRCFFCGVGGHYEGPMCQKCMARMAILSIQLYRCGVNHFKVATSSSFRHEKRGRHLEADSRVVGAH